MCCPILHNFVSVAQKPEKLLWGYLNLLQKLFVMAWIWHSYDFGVSTQFCSSNCVKYENYNFSLCFYVTKKEYGI